MGTHAAPPPLKGHCPQFSANVRCGQTAEWIPLGMEVDLGPGHIVLDGDPAPPKGVQPPILGPYLLWPHGWMDQDATWDEGRPWPRPVATLCYMGTQLPSEKGARPRFSAHVYCGQTVAHLSTAEHLLLIYITAVKLTR